MNEDESAAPIDVLADIDAMIAASEARMTDRERAEWAEHEASMERSVPVPCAWGWCVHLVDPLTNVITSGMGPVACPHDHLPGWRSRYPAGHSKPPVPVKAVGRHGSRKQRSRGRDGLPNYPGLVPEWLAARPTGPPTHPKLTARMHGAYDGSDRHRH